MNDRTGESEEKEVSPLREVIGGILCFVMILSMAYLMIVYVGQRTQVSGMSMYPTLNDGDNLIVDKISYRFREPERYDIIVFPFRYKENTFYIKRIIGLPGEEIQVKDGEVYINGEILGEDYGREPMESAGIAEEPVTLGEDEYFVLGDNRNASSDSRDSDVGIVRGKDFIGRAFFRVWPLTEFGTLKHG